MNRSFVLLFALALGCVRELPPPGGTPDPIEAPTPPSEQPPQEPPLPLKALTDGMEIRESMRAEPGTYRFDRPLRVAADGVTLDLNGATLLGAADGVPADSLTATAILVEGRKGVTVKNGKLLRYKVGVHAKDSKDLALTDLDVSDGYRMHLGSTPEREDSADWLWPHDNEQNQWMTRYGAAIYLERCTAATVARNVARRRQNGILLTRTEGSFVYDNDASFNSGWGVALYRSSRNEVSHNRLDYNVRGYSHGVYNRGQDSAGILVFEQSQANVFAYNSATHSGDGYFGYAGHETTQRTGKGGSGDNLLYRNDFSHAVAHGIEMTFSDGNQFIENVMDECDNGIWAGYSYNTRIEGNRITRSYIDGIAIEHGNRTVIRGNTFGSNRQTAIHLWWDADPELVNGVYGRNQDTGSHDYQVEGNRIIDGPLGLDLDTTRTVSIKGNELSGLSGAAVRVKGSSSGVRLEGNNVLSCDKTLVNQSATAVTVGGNWDDRGVNNGALTQSSPPATAKLALDLSPAPYPAPPLKGALDAFLPSGTLRGRHTIVVDEWGPIDPSLPRLFPTQVDSAASEVKLFVYGRNAGYQVTEVSPGVSVTPMQGTSPATLTVKATGSGVVPFSVKVTVAGQAFEAKGMLLKADWRVRFWTWPNAGPQKPPADWAAVVAGTPADELTVSQLDFRWSGAPTSKLPADHFATVAETELTVPADGSYELKTISDDGIRVYLDGQRVIDNWTYHGPTEDKATVRLTAGARRLKVEHFEIDGYAALQLFLKPLPSR